MAEGNSGTHMGEFQEICEKVQLCLYGRPFSENEDNTTTTIGNEIGHLENCLSKFSANHQIDHLTATHRTGNINLLTDFDESNFQACITQWQCIYCSFINTKTTDFCNMCFKAPVNNAESELANPLRLQSDKLVDKHYNYIVDQCRSLRMKFFDIKFKPNFNSLCYNLKNKRLFSVQWRRIRDAIGHSDKFCSDFTIFNNPMATDVIQSKLENTWMLGSAAALTLRRSLLYELFGGNVYYSKQGVYKINLFFNGKWTTVLIDDQFPCDNNGHLIYSKTPGKQLWVILLEKAAAKLFGCYEALTHGSPAEGFSLLTGQPCESLYLHREGIDNDVCHIDYNSIWNQLMLAKDFGFIMAAMCGGNPIYTETDYQNVGLRKNCTYAILDLYQIDNIGFIKLYDTYGTGIWVGDSVFHADKWLGKYKTQLPSLSFCDGTVWMPFDFFIKHFFFIDICKISDWHLKTVEGVLSPILKSNGLSCYLLEVPTHLTKVNLTIFQDAQRYREADKRKLMDLSIVIFKKNGPIIGNLVQYSKRKISSFVSCSITLEPGEYIVMPLAFNHIFVELDFDPRFVLNIHSSSELSIDQIEMTDYLLGDLMVKLVLAYGIRYQVTERLNLYLFTKSWSGAIILIENGYGAEWIHLHCNSDASKNLISTRRSLQTFDYVPPLSYQIINVLTHAEMSDTFNVLVNYGYLIRPHPVSDIGILNYPQLDGRVIGLHRSRPLAW